MGRHQRCRDFKTSYNLSPEDAYVLSQRIKKKGGLTVHELRIVADKYHVAKKTIHQLHQQLKLPVKHDQDAPPKSSAWRKAEQHFSQKAPAPEPVSEAPPEQSEPVEAPIAWEELRELEQSMKAEQDRLLGELAAYETEMNEARRQAAEATEKAEQESRRAEDAIQKTKRLRVETKADREELETLRAEVLRLRRMEATRQKKFAKTSEEVEEKLRQAQDNEKWALDQLSEAMYREETLKDELVSARGLILKLRKEIKSEA